MSRRHPPETSSPSEGIGNRSRRHRLSRKRTSVVCQVRWHSGMHRAHDPCGPAVPTPPIRQVSLRVDQPEASRLWGRRYVCPAESACKILPRGRSHYGLAAGNSRPWQSDTAVSCERVSHASPSGDPPSVRVPPLSGRQQIPNEEFAFRDRTCGRESPTISSDPAQSPGHADSPVEARHSVADLLTSHPMEPGTRIRHAGAAHRVDQAASCRTNPQAQASGSRMSGGLVVALPLLLPKPSVPNWPTRSGTGSWPESERCIAITIPGTQRHRHSNNHRAPIS